MVLLVGAERMSKCLANLENFVVDRFGLCLGGVLVVLVVFLWEEERGGVLGLRVLVIGVERILIVFGILGVSVGEAAFFVVRWVG